MGRGATDLDRRGGYDINGRDRWGRQEWCGFADQLLSAATRHFAPGAAQLQLPGAEGGYGRRVDGLEAFSRVFLLAAMRSAGDPSGPHERLDRFAEGLLNGTAAGRSTSWPRLPEHGQAKVEAASLAISLDLTRSWLWDRLSVGERGQVVDYLADAVGDDTYPRINWVWFRLMVQTFLRSVGGPHSLDEMRADLDTHDTFTRADGWLADGNARSFDHYVGWVLHLFPALWARMAGSEGLREARVERDRAALDRYLVDAVRLVGSDGSPLLQGRSLIYRFAAAAPFWAGILSEVESVPPGQLRRASELMVRHFACHGAPNAEGLLDLGWHGSWPRLAQSYSGTGSPYWASFGLLGVALPADHPVWSAPDLALPSEVGDQLFTIAAPGWLVSSTSSDGVVRVINHGTDHGHEGEGGADSPLYARLGYSTTTCPLLDDGAWVSGAEGVVGLVDGRGRMSHRTGWTPGVLEASEGVGRASSGGAVGWLADDAQQDGHGTGLAGGLEAAGELRVVSVLRGAWEVRLARVEGLVGNQATALRFWGWPASGAVLGGLEPLVAGGRPLVAEHEDASPLTDRVQVRGCDFDVVPGRWCAVLVTLAAALPEPGSCTLAVDDGGASVTWPDGVTTWHSL